MKRALTFMSAVALSVSLGARVARADTTVQVPLGALLDGRTVATLTGGVVVPWTLGSGVDGGGGGNGYMTMAASKSLGQNVKALPDDGMFPANTRHPDIALHFSNAADATSQQTHPVKGATNFSFAVPVATYSKMFLLVTSSEGSSAIKVTLTYADATTDVVNITVPDYFNDVSATDPVVFILYGDMAKWGHDNKVAEQNHHNLDGVEVHPSATKMLTNIRVDKTANAYLDFWGATGIATSAVVMPDGGTSGANDAGTNADASPDGGGGSSTAGTGGGAAGTNGAAGASGAAGTGAAGTSGPTTGGAGTAAPATGEAGTSGGAAGSTATGFGGSGAAGTRASGSSSSSGCSCRTSGDGAAPPFAAAALLGLVIAWRGRRRAR
jgi:MYXO-CTERM domain-containing protein